MRVHTPIVARSSPAVDLPTKPRKILLLPRQHHPREAFQTKRSAYRPATTSSYNKTVHQTKYPENLSDRSSVVRMIITITTTMAKRIPDTPRLYQMYQNRSSVRLLKIILLKLLFCSFENGMRPQSNTGKTLELVEACLSSTVLVIDFQAV